MADIPAPLANRHTSVAVVALCLLGASSALAAALVPDDVTVVWLLVVRQLVFAVQAAVLALAVFLVWRTLARRTLAAAAAGLVAIAGLLLVALTQLVWLLRLTPADGEIVVAILVVLTFLSAVLIVVGFLGLGVILARGSSWHGPTRFTLLIAAIVGAGAFSFPAVYALWSLVLIGLAVGLRAPRVVVNAGFPGVVAA